MTTLEYSLWVLLAAPVGIQCFRIRQDLRQILSPRTIIAFGFLFLYVISYLVLDAESGEYLLTRRGYDSVLILATAGLYLFFGGFEIGRQGVYDAGPRIQIDRALVFTLLLLFVSAGGWGVFLSRSGGFAAYYGSVHGEAGAWDSTSAYIYSLQLFFFPVVYILFFLFLYRRLSPWYWPVLCGLCIFLLCDAWWTGSRGALLRLMVLVGVPLLARNLPRRVPQFIVPVAMVLAMIAVVLTPYVRVATSLGSEVSVIEVVQETFREYIPLAGSTAGSGNELIVASALVEGARDTGVFDLGWQWAHPVVNFVPRFLWPDKPYAAEWSIDVENLVWTTQGWAVAKGAVPTGVADAFLRFGWLSPAVWALFGWWGGRLWSGHSHGNHLVRAGYQAAYLIGLIYMVTMGFIAAFYGWFYFAVAIWAMALFCRYEPE